VETDNEEDLEEGKKMPTTDWNLAIKFVPHFTGVKREVSKFVYHPCQYVNNLHITENKEIAG
jgi:hypothetical protein